MCGKRLSLVANDVQVCTVFSHGFVVGEFSVAEFLESESTFGAKRQGSICFLVLTVGVCLTMGFASNKKGSLVISYDEFNLAQEKLILGLGPIMAFLFFIFCYLLKKKVILLLQL